MANFYLKPCVFHAVLQAELLQAQGEVRMLLDRVSESSRDKAEMVSSKVHTQLMAIADEKVMAGERRAQIMEREVGVSLYVVIHHVLAWHSRPFDPVYLGYVHT